MTYFSWQPSKPESYLYIDQWFKEQDIVLDNHFLVGDYDTTGIIISSYNDATTVLPELFDAQELTPEEVLDLVKDQATGVINKDSTITFTMIERA